MTTETELAKKKPPPGLGDRGRVLWLAVARSYILTCVEDELLLEAARTADDAERLAVSLVDAPATVVGSAGQPRPNPLSKELRETRLLLGRLLAQLEIPASESDGQSAPWDNLTASERSRKAAHARWKRGG